MQRWNTESIALAAGVVLVGLAGSALAGADPIQLEPSRGEVRHAGHIYFNVATGEKITTLIGAGDTQGAAVGDPGTEIWIADTGVQCADQGYSTEYFWGLDDPTATGTFSLNMICFDWGDIASDTVVDCVQVHWVTDHADTDTDGDSVADGIEGFGARWLFWDGMNGRSPRMECIAHPIIGFSFFGLQGEYPVDTATLALWTADIDLGGSFGTALTFEIADTDGDLQGAAVASEIAFPVVQDDDSDSIPDWDIDADGLADWGWSIQFNQPGTIDVDNADSDSNWQTGIDGDLGALATAGIMFGSPTPGHAEFDSVGGGWDWVSDGPTAGKTEDAFTLGLTGNPDGSGALTIFGAFWFGGLDCSAGQTAGYTPASHFQTVLYGPLNCGVRCPVDMPSDLSEPCPSGDGALNFLDISYFLSFYAQGDLFVDFAGNPDGSPDGVLNFLDVSAFLAMFAAGCP